MNTKALFAAVVLGGVSLLFAGCGDGDSTKIVICRAKQVTCLSDQGGEVCSADGTQWLPFDCNEGESCAKVPDGDDNSSNDTYGCEGGCTPGKTECGSEAISRVCSADGKTWLQIPCQPGTGCDTDMDNETYGTCVRLDDDDPSVSVCDEGEVTCADATTLKACELDRSGWRYTACAANERCEESDDGAACVVDPDQGCVPNSGTCMDLTHVRYCSPDGKSYEEPIEECPDGTTCADGGCQGPVCTVNAVRCADVVLGGGNILTAIENGTIDPQARYTCNDDGTAWEISFCESNAVCIYDNISAAAVNAFVEEAKSAYRDGRSLPSFEVPSSSRATCEVPDCTAPFAIRELFGDVAEELTRGSFACGDPTDEAPEAGDFLESFSLCEGLAPYVKPHWANYGCPENTQCTYTSATGGGSSEEGSYIMPACEQQCRPKTKACFSEGSGGAGTPLPPELGISAYGESTIECGDDGTWDYATIEPCQDPQQKDVEWWCGPNLKGTADNYNLGVCMAPACAYWFDYYGTFALPEDVGACGTDGQFRPCLQDGTLGEPRDCATCNALSAPAQTYAGLNPGRCVECEENEQRCVYPFASPDGARTPFYETCSNGKFESETCDDGELCQEYTELDEDGGEYGLQKILCGGECQPQTSRCVDADGVPDVGGKLIQHCSNRGEWEDAEECDFGACHEDEQQSTFSGTVRCEGECIEGTKICVGGLEARCDDGRYKEGVDELIECEDDQFCYAGVGCAECAPRSIVCESATEIKICNDDGEFEDPVTCPGDEPVCVSGSPAYCLPPVFGGGEGGTAGVAGSAGGGTGGASAGTAGTAAGTSGSGGASASGGTGGTGGSDGGSSGTAAGGSSGSGGTAAFGGVGLIDG